MNTTTVLTIICAIVTCSAACNHDGRSDATARISPTGSVDRTVALDVAGTERLYRVHLPPAYDPRRPAPLVLVLHGGGGSPERIARITSFSTLSDEKGFLVIYPEALTGHWNDGRATPAAATADDVAFIAKLIDRAGVLFAIDPQRVYAAGISNGGMMVQRLAAELPDKIAAIAAVAAPLPEDLVSRFAPAEPVSVLMIHGTADNLVPYAGGPVRGPVGGRVLSVAETIDRWLTANGCTNRTPSTAVLDADPTDATRVRRETYTGCNRATAVVLYTIEGGGHAWPGGLEPGRFGRLVGPTSRHLDATRVIWEFFETHPKI